MKTSVLFSSIFFMADSVFRGCTMILCSSRRGSCGIDLRGYLGARESVLEDSSVSIIRGGGERECAIHVQGLRAMKSSRCADLEVLAGVSLFPNVSEPSQRRVIRPRLTPFRAAFAASLAFLEAPPAQKDASASALVQDSQNLLLLVCVFSEPPVQLMLTMATRRRGKIRCDAQHVVAGFEFDFCRFRMWEPSREGMSVS